MSAWKEDFEAAWNSSESLDEFLVAYPRKIKRRSASSMAANLRAEGYDLKSFAHERGGGQSDDKQIAAAIKKLRDKGATYQEIADVMNVSRQAVYWRLNKGE